MSIGTTIPPTVVTDSTSVYNAGNSGTALTINLNNGIVQRITLTGNVTLTINNPVDGKRYILFFDTGAGSFTVAWPGAVLWSGGVAPIITASASKVDVVVLIYRGDTAKYYGAFTQNY